MSDAFFTPIWKKDSYFSQATPTTYLLYKYNKTEQVISNYLHHGMQKSRQEPMWENSAGATQMRENTAPEKDY